MLACDIGALLARDRKGIGKGQTRTKAKVLTCGGGALLARDRDGTGGDSDRSYAGSLSL
jgi:hypothetical protein